MTTSPSTLAARDHVPGIDALRVLGSLLVVVLHSAIPYAHGPMPGLVWPIGSHDAAFITDAIFWWIEGFVMPLFFLIAGYCAAQLLATRPASAFLAHRARRVLLPLLAGAVTILPLCLYIWALGWVVEGRYPIRKLQSLKFDGPEGQHLWGLAHLWFLEYLFLYCLSAWAVRRWREKKPRDHAPRAGILGSRGLSPWLWMLSGAAILWCDPQIVIGMRQGMLPAPFKLLYYALFFSAGMWVHRRQPWSFPSRRASVAYLSLSALMYLAMMPLAHRSMVGQLSPSERVLLALVLSAFAWLTTLGLLGWCVQRVRQATKLVSYLADASFWVYLTHLPWVALAQIDLRYVAIPAWVKLLTVIAVTLFMTLSTYHLLVRHTWLGAWLNGRRVPRPGEDVEQSATPRRQAA